MILKAMLMIAALDGNTILAQSVAAPGLHSYSVPVHFDVRMHRPISIKSGVEAVVYYKSPASAALNITKIPGPLGHFFKSSYAIDLAPQTWPVKYNVLSVSTANSDSTPVYVLTAVAKHDPSLKQVVFKVTQQSNEPVSAAWSFTDGSSITLTIANQTVNGFTLPATETVSVNESAFALDASATYGTYGINASIPDAVFQQQ
jgi:hypothetical protein